MMNIKCFKNLFQFTMSNNLERKSWQSLNQVHTKINHGLTVIKVVSSKSLQTSSRVNTVSIHGHVKARSCWISNQWCCVSTPLGKLGGCAVATIKNLWKCCRMIIINFITLVQKQKCLLRNISQSFSWNPPATSTVLCFPSLPWVNPHK